MRKLDMDDGFDLELRRTGIAVVVEVVGAREIVGRPAGLYIARAVCFVMSSGGSRQNPR